ncbi:acyltransferase [Corynebacterium aquatimens]|uniref:Peptidoglycan/LPS O-acetylase OafA/YrhL n=1 Tax=Corynebacterium aquatimens TaxID=1190508 RepID=A0A931GXZ2_9CORY|nr:peptidoglycan/LPS O-acetylase OafA/YrhL [Corynebacterium aquatimens]WJY66801.1 O-acetyltransferase OatA [Corynebacterium aquatimens]
MLPELEGLRAVAALGIVITHVAFQTGTYSPLLERFDFFVAVFFALSAFLLARGTHRSYWRRRFARIAPAYLVCVTVVMAALPQLAGLRWGQVAANLTLTQIYVPHSLIDGLTHLWSLCVEVAFYLVLPLYLALGRGGRAVAVSVFVVGSLAWPWLPLDAWGSWLGGAVAGLPGAPFGAGLSPWINLQIWPISYAPWFAVGLVCALCEGTVPRPRIADRPFPRWVLPLLSMGIAWFSGVVGPAGLTHPSASEFNVRILLGALFAACWVAPYALWPGQSLLAHPWMRALGRWSYSIFLWHVAVLAMAFPVLGIELFSGGFVPVLVFTVAVSVAVAYVSYHWVEKPAARIARR